MAARDRDLPEQVAAWYEDWIFLFVGWCLEAPPHRVHRDRIGDFWVALTEHPRVRRWKVCQAMDALGVLFGALGGPEALSFPGGTLPGGASDPDVDPSSDALEAPSHYLPDDTLPEAVEPRALVPTRTVRPAEDDETATDEAPPETQAESAPKTLFNPTGGAPSRASSRTSENPDPAPDTPDRDAGDADRTVGDAAEDDGPDDLVSVEMPRGAARRLRDAARRLGVPTAVFAARAVDLLREETGVAEGQTLDTGVLLRRYQARIDLLHRRGLPDAADDEAPALTVDVEASDAYPRAEGPAALDSWSGDGRPATAPALDVNEN